MIHQQLMSLGPMHDQQPRFATLASMNNAQCKKSRIVSDQNFVLGAPHIYFVVVHSYNNGQKFGRIHCEHCSLGQSWIVHDQLLDASLKPRSLHCVQSPQILHCLTALWKPPIQHRTCVLHILWMQNVVCLKRYVMLHHILRQEKIELILLLLERIHRRTPAHNYLLRTSFPAPSISANIR